MKKYLVILGLCIGCTLSFCSLAENESKSTAVQTSATILLYHHVSSETPTSTSVSVATFTEHMQYLADNHTVISVDHLLRAIKNKQPLPNKAVAITFDDGFNNILKNAHPILQEFDFPYTVFINPGQIGTGSQLNWDEVQKMSKEGVVFANHTLDHAHLLTRFDGESKEQWLSRVVSDVTTAEEWIEEKLGYSKKWIAYPFGEFNVDVTRAMAKEGYIGFGQQSGAVGPFSDFNALARFPAAGPYAKLSTLTTKLQSLALPIISSSVQDTILPSGASPGKVVLTIDNTKEDVNLARFACYFKGESLTIKHTNNDIIFNIDQALRAGRSRVNCTAPSISQPSRFYWYSQPWFVATEKGQYLD